MWSTIFHILVAPYRAILAAFLPKHKLREPINLQSLPSEILSEIIRQLPQSGAISLSYTSREFYRIVFVKIEDLFERFPYAHESWDRLNDQKTYKLITAKRPCNVVRCLSKEYAFDRSCAICRTNHEMPDYSITALRQAPKERKCLTVEGIMWLCPSMVFSLTEVLELRRDYELNRPGCQDRINGLCMCGQHYTRIIDDTIFQVFPIAAFQRRHPNQIDMSRAIMALRSVQVRICPHTSVSDETVIRALCDSWRCRQVSDFDLHLKCYCCLRKHYSCSKCQTTIQFRHRDIPNSWNFILSLAVGKPIGKNILSRNRHERWRSLVTLPSEVLSREEEWGRCFEEFRDHHRIEGRSVLTPEWDPWPLPW